MDRYVDVVYYASAVIMLICLLSTLKVCLANIKNSAKPQKSFATGFTMTAVGLLIVLMAGVICNIVLKNTSIYQQCQYTLFYIGFLSVLFGDIFIAKGIVVNNGKLISQEKIISKICIAIFTILLVISAFYLFKRNLFVFNEHGMQIQLKVYWLPILWTNFAGILMFGYYRIKASKPLRYISLYMALANLLLTIGLLKEGLFIPNTASPFTDNLIVFVPFTVFCLAAFIISIFAVKQNKKIFDVT